MEWLPVPLRRYVQCSGRSRRKEFWTFILVLTIVRCALAVVADFARLRSDLAFTFLTMTIDLATLFLLVAFGARRLHDANRSGAWLLAPLVATMPGVVMMDADFTQGMIVAVVGEIVALAPILFFLCQDGTWGDNRFGPDPKQREPRDLDMTRRAHRIFSYGTLRDPAVQQALYGRRLSEEADCLSGFTRSLIPISDQEVVRVSGATHHPMLVASGDPADRIDGAVLMLDDEELRITDDYEGADYRRIAVTLESGRTAFVYVGKDDA